MPDFFCFFFSFCKFIFIFFLVHNLFKNWYQFVSPRVQQEQEGCNVGKFWQLIRCELQFNRDFDVDLTFLFFLFCVAVLAADVAFLFLSVPICILLSFSSLSHYSLGLSSQESTFIIIFTLVGGILIFFLRCMFSSIASPCVDSLSFSENFTAKSFLSFQRFWLPPSFFLFSSLFS